MTRQIAYLVDVDYIDGYGTQAQCKHRWHSTHDNSADALDAARHIERWCEYPATITRPVVRVIVSKWTPGNTPNSSQGDTIQHGQSSRYTAGGLPTEQTIYARARSYHAYQLPGRDGNINEYGPWIEMTEASAPEHRYPGADYRLPAIPHHKTPEFVETEMKGWRPYEIDQHGSIV